LHAPVCKTALAGGANRFGRTRKTRCIYYQFCQSYVGNSDQQALSAAA
jgi:hypothetical protein